MTYIEPEDDQQTQTEEQHESNDIRNLRRQAKEAVELRKQVDEQSAATRELAFLKAGIDTDTPIGQLFMRAYDGELDKDTIVAAYAELGGGSTSSSESEQSADAAEATRERQQLAAGAAGDTGDEPAVPVRGEKGAAVKAGREALQSGAPRDDAMGVTFGAIVSAAAEGDRSVIVPRIGEA